MAPATESSQNTNEQADDSVKWDDAVGTRFKPTDQVLAGYYLAGKVSGRTHGPIFPLIKEEDIYRHEPSELSSIAHDFGDGMMYFFTPIHKKYQKGKNNIDRIAPGGCWKKTGKPSYVNGEDGKPIAVKTSLAYYKNDPKSGKSIKSQWLMKEYMNIENQRSDGKSKMKSAASLTLCVVYFHDKKRKRCESENELLHDFKDNPNSVLDMVDGSSYSFLPQTHVKSNQVFEQNLNGHEIFFDDFSMSFDENTSCSNPQVFYPDSLEQGAIPIFANSDQNMLNTVMGYEGLTDDHPNFHLSNLYLSPSPPALDPENTLDLEKRFDLAQDSGESLDQFLNCFVNNQQPHPDLCQNLSCSTAAPLSNKDNNNDLLDKL